ncbi:MAG: hypothetical protein M1823_007357 [Watsoniomyces obsoletus]|nr:MAG: hypothetical protein M1823_007357 [Watsoniomyces obsoletus]
MAELAPVGVFIGDASGQITFVNDAWFRLSSYPGGGPAHKPVDDDWLDYVLEEDQVKASTAWATMFANKVPVSIEFRFKTPWKDKMGNTGVTWVIASAYPEKDGDGNIQRIFGSVTDISDQKFAEILQTKRMEEAVIRKLPGGFRPAGELSGATKTNGSCVCSVVVPTCSEAVFDAANWLGPPSGRKPVLAQPANATLHTHRPS